MDMIVGNKIILEFKSVSQLKDEHFNQMIHYLKATNLQLGLLINFGEERVNIKRVINTPRTKN